MLDLLYAGPSYPAPPSFSLATRLKPQQNVGSVPPIDIDVTRIELIRTFNAVTPARIGPMAYDEVNFAGSLTPDAPSALLRQSPLFNHSCTPNCVVRFLGDAVFVRPTRDFGTNEELTISYFSGIATSSASLEERFQELQRWGFSCCCRRCQENAKEPPEQRALRLQILSDLPTAPTSLMDDYIVSLTACIIYLCDRFDRAGATYSPGYPTELRTQLVPLGRMIIVRPAHAS
jgi:hypothetical protein